MANGVNGINKYWKIALAIVGLIVAWTTLKIAVADNTNSIGSLEVEQDKTTDVIHRIDINMATVVTELKYLNEKIDARD